MTMRFNYQTICANLLKGLPQRTTDVIERRFGLKGGEGETLEAIGKTHGLTRERVRQIEQYGLSRVRAGIREHPEVLKYFKKVLASFGGVKKEQNLLEVLGGDRFKNQVFFLLTNSEDFKRIPEDEKFYPFWLAEKTFLNQVKVVVKSVINRFQKEKKIFSLKELLTGESLNKKAFLSFIEISKEIEKNPEGRYGLRDWLEINPRGVKDRAYLVLKKTKKPLHFSEITSLIEKLPFPSPASVQVATVHNELIRDQRFVLVGRGLYALSEWGYTPGVIKDVIIKTLKEAKKPLAKEEIMEKVLKQRFVKANTISLNLNDKTYFLRNSDGKYQIKEI